MSYFFVCKKEKSSIYLESISELSLMDEADPLRCAPPLKQQINLQTPT